MVIPSPDVLSVVVDAVSLALVPDAVRFAKPSMCVRFIATLAPIAFPVMLKPMIVAFVKLSIFIVLHVKDGLDEKSHVTTHC